MQTTVFKWTEQQEAVFKAVLDQKSSIVVEAVAGSGKTTTIKEACLRLKAAKPGLVIKFTSFGKKVVENLKAVIPADVAECGTMNSLCCKVWNRYVGRFVQVNEYQRDKLVHQQLKTPYELQRFVNGLVEKAKQNGAGLVDGFKLDSYDKFEELVYQYDLDFEIGENPWKRGNENQIDQGIKYAIKALKLHIEMSSELIGFVDQLFMPLLHNCKFDQVDVLFVDEVQDFSILEKLVSKAMVKLGGFVYAVGDRRQAIYGFRGADSKSMDNFRAEFGAIDLPLTVSYRVPRSGVLEAQRHVSHIQSAPNAIEGKVTHTNYATMLGLVDNNTAIICRKVAPLLELAFTLIGKGIKCQVAGKDIGKGLVGLVYKWKTPKTVDEYLEKLTSYRDEQVQKLMAKGKEVAAEKISDQTDTILKIAESVPGDASLTDLYNKIVGIFTEDKDLKESILTLSTIHKAKGLEWDKVCILGSEKYQPSKFARQDWQLEQEENLFYIAKTRHKQELIYVTAKPE